MRVAIPPHDVVTSADRLYLQKFLLGKISNAPSIPGILLFLFCSAGYNLSALNQLFVHL